MKAQQAMEQAGVTHCDIKPANVLLKMRGWGTLNFWSCKKLTPTSLFSFWHACLTRLQDLAHVEVRDHRDVICDFRLPPFSTPSLSFNKTFAGLMSQCVTPACSIACCAFIRWLVT